MLCYVMLCYVMLCGYYVPGMILLCDLTGAMRLDRDKDTSVHVSVCTS